VWGEEGMPLRVLKGHEDSITAIEGLNPQGGLSQSCCLVATGIVGLLYVHIVLTYDLYLHSKACFHIIHGSYLIHSSAE
jgi:hypothetical protein